MLHLQTHLRAIQWMKLKREDTVKHPDFKKYCFILYRGLSSRKMIFGPCFMALFLSFGLTLVGKQQAHCSITYFLNSHLNIS